MSRVDFQDIHQLLGIEHPWRVKKITQDDESQTAEIHVVWSKGSVLRCPECDKVSPGYDRRRRRWRHTDICDYRTMVAADVPRVECSEHGPRTISVPWADDRMRHTTSFEKRVIGWLKDASMLAIAQKVGVSWDTVAKIVKRGGKHRNDQ